MSTAWIFETGDRARDRTSSLVRAVVEDTNRLVSMVVMKDRDQKVFVRLSPDDAEAMAWALRAAACRARVSTGEDQG